MANALVALVVIVLGVLAFRSASNSGAIAGFTGSGIAAGSLAAWIQSVFGVSWLFSLLQSLGAIGLLGFFGGPVGVVVGIALAVVVFGSASNSGAIAGVAALFSYLATLAGFTGSGIAAGSLAAWIQSVFGVSWLFSLLQSLGAIGLLGFFGGPVGVVVGVVGFGFYFFR